LSGYLPSLSRLCFFSFVVVCFCFLGCFGTLSSQAIFFDYFFSCGGIPLFNREGLVLGGGHRGLSVRPPCSSGLAGFFFFCFLRLVLHGVKAFRERPRVSAPSPVRPLPPCWFTSPLSLRTSLLVFVGSFLSFFFFCRPFSISFFV